MDVAVLADTHIPDRAKGLPDPFRRRIRTADHVVHAGDVSSKTALADVRSLAPELTVVAGNVDRLDLPVVAAVDLGGVTVGVTHGHRHPDGRPTRSRADWMDAVVAAARSRREGDRDGDPEDGDAGAGDADGRDDGDGDGRDGALVGVGAHTHEVLDAVHDGVRVLNPGSATGAPPADGATMMTLAVEDGEFSVSVHRGPVPDGRL